MTRDPLCPYCGTSGAVQRSPLRCACRRSSDKFAYVNASKALRSIPEVGSDSWIEARLTSIHRETRPSARGEGLWRYTRNGGRAKARGCRLCPAETSWCGDWRRTVTSEREEADDVARHIRRVRNLVAEGLSFEAACRSVAG